MERTLSIVKPDAVAAGHLGAIIARFQGEGLKIAAIRMVRLSRPEAEGFYAVHKDRPFFPALVDFMVSGPCALMVLEGEDAIRRNRAIMGATDPADADDGTIRKLYAASKQQNAVHGSDAPETARQEISWFFRESEIF